MSGKNVWLKSLRTIFHQIRGVPVEILDADSIRLLKSTSTVPADSKTIMEIYTEIDNLRKKTG